MSANKSAALPVAYAVLRILIVLNWIYAALLIAILTWSVLHTQWTFIALGVPATEQSDRLVLGMRTIAALGILTVPFNLAMLRRLVAIVHTVREGNPFIASNANRLQSIAWILVALQFVSVAVWLVGKLASTAAHPLHLNAGFSPSGWLAVILTFVLARVFAEGTSMREDLEGTV